MKRFTSRDFKFLSVSALVLILISALSFGMKSVLSQDQLPEKIKSFVSDNFPGNPVITSIKEKDGLNISYKVILEGPVKLEFNRKFEIIDMESHLQLPEKALPAAIVEYVKTNFPDQFITDWELEGNKQEVELDSGLDLIFSTSGEFIRID